MKQSDEITHYLTSLLFHQCEQGFFDANDGIISNCPRSTRLKLKVHEIYNVKEAVFALGEVLKKIPFKWFWTQVAIKNSPESPEQMPSDTENMIRVSLVFTNLCRYCGNLQL